MSNTPYPISKLEDISENRITNISSSLIELVVDDYGNNEFVNKKVTYKAFGDFLISSHAIFNKLDEVFNDKTVTEIDSLGETTYPHRADIYFGGQTYFNKNPSSTSSEDFAELKQNQMIRKEQLENVLHENTLEIRSLKNNLKYKQNVVRGIYKELDPPIYDELTFRPFYTTSTKCKFKTPIFNGKLFATNAIRLPDEGNFVTIVGKVKVPIDLLEQTSAYYTPELKLWVGLLYIKNLIAITELHNIDGNGIAYFSFQVPSVKDKLNKIQRVRIVLPFQPADAESSGSTSRDLFQNIAPNSAAVFYYTV